MNSTALSAAALATLGLYNFIILIDTSGSMGAANKKSAPGGHSRWTFCQESAAGFARDVAKIDDDGIDVITFGGAGIVAHTGVNAEKVESIFATQSPRGTTPLAEALEKAFGLANASDKKAFIVVFTDGVPDDEKAAADAIIKQANSQETDDRCTVLFVQIGDDEAATDYLRKLDDELTTAKFDIVDAKTQAQADAFPSTAELVLHAIDD